MEILYSDEKPQVHIHSSIDQYKKFLATYERGGWTPIEFDYLDYIDCNRPVTHPVIIEFGDEIGYHFPISECSFTTDDYQKFDYKGVELRALPDCLGAGFYQAYEEGEEIINFDGGSALSTRNEYRLRIGQHYYLADEILPADDVE